MLTYPPPNMFCPKNDSPKIRSYSACARPAAAEATVSRCSVLSHCQSLPEICLVELPSPEPQCCIDAKTKAPRTPVSCKRSHRVQPPPPPLILNSSGRRRRHRKPQPANWTQMALLLRQRGLVRAAQAIVHDRCAMCERQQRSDKRTMIEQAAMLEGVQYSAAALNEFTQRAWRAQEAQFGRWPLVYRQMPRLHSEEAAARAATAAKIEDTI